jgi:hypothetical protein
MPAGPKGVKRARFSFVDIGDPSENQGGHGILKDSFDSTSARTDS